MKYQNKQAVEAYLPFVGASRLTSFVVCLTFFSHLAAAGTITVTFSPSQSTPAGETGSAPTAETANNYFSLWGVQYQLTGGDDSGCASDGGNSLCFGDTIGTAALGLTLLSDPVLSGPLTPDVELTLSFASATSDLDFAVAVGTLLDTTGCPTAAEAYTDSTTVCPASVALYNGAGSLITGGTFDWTLPDDSFITEGEFSYSGPSVSTAVLTFPTADSSDTEFAIDNLTYQTTVTAPEPAYTLLIGIGFIAIGWRRRRRS